MTSRLDFDKDKIWKPATSGAGKGDAPRNVSKRFKKNWDRINWTPRETDANGVPKPKRYKKIYGKKKITSLLLLTSLFTVAQPKPPSMSAAPASVRPAALLTTARVLTPMPTNPVGFLVIDQRVTNRTARVSFMWGTNNWDEPDLAGYKLYHGPASRAYTNVVTILGRTNSYRDYVVSITNRNFFGLTAFNTTGLESEFATNELIYPQPVPQFSYWEVVFECESTTNLDTPWGVHLTVTNYFTRTNEGQRFYRSKVSVRGIE